MGFFRNFKEVLQMEENRELTRAEIVEQDAKECFKQGLNCSECVMTAFLNHFDTGLPKEVVKLATGFGGGIRAPTAVVGERDVDERRSTVGRKGIRIEEQFALSRERALAPQRRLVLKAVVEEIVVIVAVPLGRALLRIVVERRQPVVNGLTGREPVEVVARDGVFGFDPCGRLGRIVVFQPAVGIGDARTVVVVDDGRVAPRVGIG